MTVTSSNYQRRENDMYETETWAVDALLRALPVLDKNTSIWEPAAGNHAISDHLERRGFAVVNSDIATYEKQQDFELNFFAATRKHGEAIITNPPYGKTGHKLAVRFAEHALKICDGWIALLLTAKFDFGKTRQNLFKNNKRFYGKIELVDRLSWAGNGKTGTDNHAWYVWAPNDYSHGMPRLFWEGKGVRKMEAAE